VYEPSLTAFFRPRDDPPTPTRSAPCCSFFFFFFSTLLHVFISPALGFVFRFPLDLDPFLFDCDLAFPSFLTAFCRRYPITPPLPCLSLFFFFRPRSLDHGWRAWTRFFFICVASFPLYTLGRPDMHDLGDNCGFALLILADSEPVAVSPLFHTPSFSFFSCCEHP